MTVTSQILLVEDDINLSFVLADYLRNKEFQVDLASNGQEALSMLSMKKYDIILLDIMMPVMNGWQLLKQLQESSNQIPVIVTSAKTDREDILKTYALGCDDYVVKPYSMDILICKIEAILRRVQQTHTNQETRFDLAGVAFDSTLQLLNGQHLSTRENDLLLMLCQNKDNVVERNRILNTLWGGDTYFNARSLSVYINRLRNYIGRDSRVKILSVHGKGYKLVIMNE